MIISMAKKSLGQNFLIDESVLEDITSAIDPQKGEKIVEIGPGHGELTNELLAYSLELLGENGIKIIAIEKDHELAASLKLLAAREKLGSRLEIMEGDALEILPKISSKLKAHSYKLAGNIPYYITGQLFRIIGELKNKPSLIVFTIQKEVAERICAGEGKMNLLAASIQVWAKPGIVRIVPRESFNPAPKVDSAIIKLTPNLKTKNSQLRAYYDLLHIVFKQPRKTILNNLKAGMINMKVETQDELEKNLKQLNIDSSDRPQDLSVADLSNLSRFVQ